jgi:hypothetical protein
MLLGRGVAMESAAGRSKDAQNSTITRKLARSLAHKLIISFKRSLVVVASLLLFYSLVLILLHLILLPLYLGLVQLCVSTSTR